RVLRSALAGITKRTRNLNACEFTEGEQLSEHLCDARPISVVTQLDRGPALNRRDVGSIPTDGTATVAQWAEPGCSKPRGRGFESLRSFAAWPSQSRRPSDTRKIVGATPTVATGAVAQTVRASA